MTTLAETEEEQNKEEESDEQDQVKRSSFLQHAGQSKPSTDAKEPDPLTALGDKMAQLRETKQIPNQQTIPGIQTPKQEPQEEFGHDKAKDMTTDWIATINANLTHLKNHPVETLWPRDTLFRYFQLMEALQENLAERQQLLRMGAQALLRLHDT